MEVLNVQITVPEGMVSFIEPSNEEEAMERNAMILYPYIKNLTISHGRAAEILGVNKIDLIEFYGTMGLPYLDQTKEEIEDELAAYRKKKEAMVC